MQIEEYVYGNLDENATNTNRQIEEIPFENSILKCFTSEEGLTCLHCRLKCPLWVRC